MIDLESMIKSLSLANNMDKLNKKWDLRMGSVP